MVRAPACMTPLVYTFISVVIVSLISILAATPLLVKKKVSRQVLMFLLSLSVGTLLGSVFIHFLPEIAAEGYGLSTGLFIIAGFLVFFLLEKLVHWHHSDKTEDGECAHGHAYHLAPLNLVGDGVHNFLDGLVIAGAYVISIHLGVVATIAVIFHEIPQEIADFGILLYAGLSKTKALLFNFLSAATAIVGAVVGVVLSGEVTGFHEFIIPFAAGNFLYIAAANLVPELHRHCKLWDSILHVIAILVGLGVMVLIAVLGVGH